MNQWTFQPATSPTFPIDQYGESTLAFFEESYEDLSTDNFATEMEQMTIGEFYDRLSDLQERINGESDDPEFLPALLAAAPAIISAAPGIIQGVSSLFNRPRPAAPAQRPNPRPSYTPPRPRPTTPPLPRPAPTQTRPPVRPPATPPAQPATPIYPTIPVQPSMTPSTAAPATPTSSPLDILLGLLNNPAITGAIQSAVGGNNIAIGNSTIPVSAAIDIISQLAGSLSGSEQPIEPLGQESYPDFMFDHFGNALVSLDSAEEAGILLLQKIQ